LAYVVVVATGIFSLSYAPEKIFAGETDLAVLESVRSNLALLRWSIVAEATCYVGFALLATALYRLFESTDKTTSLLLAALVWISVAMGLTNLGHLISIVRSLESGANDEAAILLALSQYKIGIFVQSIPWGLWLLPFGALVIRCGFLPRLLGAVLILAGIGYVAHFVGRSVYEDYTSSGLRNVFAAPRIGEILICFWLLLFGARRAPWAKLFEARPQSAARE
jgi:hypothetical protein